MGYSGYSGFTSSCHESACLGPHPARRRRWRFVRWAPVLFGGPIDSRFGEWWLLGTRIMRNGVLLWGTLPIRDVGVGEDSGIVPLIFFIATIVFCFKYLGIARRSFQGNKNQELYIWALGAAVFSHVVAFFGIFYFDQTLIAWHILLVIISASTYETLRSPVRQDAKPLEFNTPMAPSFSPISSHSFDLPPFVTPRLTKLTPGLPGAGLMVMNELHRCHIPDGSCASALHCILVARLQSRAALPAGVRNQCSFKHSSRNLPLKLSINAFCTGFPG